MSARSRHGSGRLTESSRTPAVDTRRRWRQDDSVINRTTTVACCSTVFMHYLRHRRERLKLSVFSFLWTYLSPTERHLPYAITTIMLFDTEPFCPHQKRFICPGETEGWFDLCMWLAVAYTEMVYLSAVRRCVCLYWQQCFPVTSHVKVVTNKWRQLGCAVREKCIPSFPFLLTYLSNVNKAFTWKDELCKRLFITHNNVFHLRQWIRPARVLSMTRSGHVLDRRWWSGTEVGSLRQCVV